MASTLITSYLGEGLLASRPATPSIATGAIGFYYATDTDILYRWSEGAWRDISNVVFSIPAPSSATFNSGAFATKGCAFIPTENFIVSGIYAPVDVAASAAYRAAIYEVTTATNPVITAVMASANLTPSTAAQNLQFTFSSPAALVAGTRYVAAITRTDSTTTTPALLLPSTVTSIPGLPLDLTLTNNHYRYVRAANINPIVSDTLTLDTGSMAIGLKASI